MLHIRFLNPRSMAAVNGLVAAISTNIVFPPLAEQLGILEPGFYLRDRFKV
ncbi:hypothetical protein NDI44_08035 [Trichocoleus sp. DQ-A3]|uniref:hypothetical protein n=1 Tax=Coleofasciculus sp. FACHB-125 TaxID=2692784 RepID=UPI0016836F53|nr:hypothetical protein [Coleofasciculus sp. FACHB-125]MBD1899141.1 hypothetical protein [Coleofasciculus sp. FACHB-125]